jgi:hypothetical protein
MKEGIDENVRTEAKKNRKERKMLLRPLWRNPSTMPSTQMQKSSRHALTLLLTSLFFAFL